MANDLGGEAGMRLWICDGDIDFAAFTFIRTWRGASSIRNGMLSLSC